MSRSSSSASSSGSEDTRPLVEFGDMKESYTDEPAGACAATGAPRMKRVRKALNRSRMAAARPHHTRNMSIALGAGALLFAAGILMLVYLNRGSPAPSDSSQRPSAVAAGSEVRVVSPAGPVPARLAGEGALLASAEAVAASLGVDGLGASVGEHALEGAGGYLAGGDGDRCADLFAAMEDGGVSLVVASTGGVGSLRLVEHFDVAAIGRRRRRRRGGGGPRARPLLMGSGDVTVLLNALAVRARVPVVYGPMADSAPWSEATARSVADTVVRGALDVFPAGSAARGHTLAGGVTSGTAVGGDLVAVASMAGTRYLPAPADMGAHVLFLEASNGTAPDVDRGLTQLLAAGYLGRAAAVVVGSLEGCDGCAAVVDERLAGLGVPAFRGAPFGAALAGARALPLGVRVAVDADQRSVALEEPLVQVSGE